MNSAEIYTRLGRLNTSLLGVITSFVGVITLFSQTLHASELAVKQQASQLGRKYGVSSELIVAIIKVESNFNPKAIGKTHGEVGLMQLRPKYFKTATFDVVNNMELGVKYLAKLKKICYPKYGKAWFICYNLGPSKTVKYPELFAYYKKVINAKNTLKNKTNRVRVASN